MNVKFYNIGRHFTSNCPHISSLLPPCASLLWLGKHRIEHTSLTSNVREAKKGEILDFAVFLSPSSFTLHKPQLHTENV